MALKTVAEYFESLRDDRHVFLDGEKVDDVVTHPILKNLTEYASADYEMALDPKYQDLLTEVLPNGERVHFTFVSPRSREDLARRRAVIQLTTRAQGGPGGAKFTGIDGINGVNLACGRIDRKLGTDYSRRVQKFRQHCMDTDAAVAVAMTDVKGSRGLHPHAQQGHQDYYVHIVSRGDDGIVVRGAKAHISHAPCANEIVVLPCRAMTKDDADYAVAFAVPANAKGLSMIGNAGDGQHPLVIFDDVFVPTERIFMAGEWEYAHHMPYSFATYHRLSADTYKYVELEVFIGCAALLAEYNGLEKVPHVRDKLSWLVMWVEGTEALGRSAVDNYETDPESGTVYPNTLYSNVAKHFYASNYHEAEKYLQDIAGGLVCTLPSLLELDNPQTSGHVRKYLGINEKLTADDRMRIFRLAQKLCGYFNGNITIHAEGSLAAQKMMLYVNADWERYKALAKREAGVATDHPLVRALPTRRGGHHM
jgi:4-hydroxybutyryl-CoA dehydratase / vinylacetyl-CoA-Delta-isomerase